MPAARREPSADATRVATLQLEIPCALCGALAMRVVTTATGDPIGLVGEVAGERTPFLAPADGVATVAGGASRWAAASLVDGGLAAVEAGLRARDVPGLLRLDPEIVPLFCSTCGLAYCTAHWTLWDEFDPDDPGWYDETRGRCPKDHVRRVYD
jgi:hypothetical protein